MKKSLPLLILTFLLGGCDFSLTQYLATEEQKSTIEQLLLESEYEYDKGNYDDALSVAMEAYNINPDNEETSVQIGYIYLSKSGLDGFNLAEKLIEDNKENEGAGNTNKTASLFSNIAEVIGVDETEIELLSSGTQTSSGTGIIIYQPETASTARTSGSSIISNINLAIQYFCPFVSEESKLHYEHLYPRCQ